MGKKWKTEEYQLCVERIIEFKKSVLCNYQCNNWIRQRSSINLKPLRKVVGEQKYPCSLRLLFDILEKCALKIEWSSGYHIYWVVELVKSSSEMVQCYVHPDVMQ